MLVRVEPISTILWCHRTHSFMKGAAKRGFCKGATAPPHSAGKCDVIGPKNHVPMGTKVEKVPNQLYQGHLNSMWTFRQKIILAPGVKSPEPMSLDPKFFLGSNPLNKVPVSLPHPQKNIWGSNVVPFWNRESNFEAEILSPNGWVGSILLSFLHKITHSIY